MSRYREKPSLTYDVSTGVYVYDERALTYLPAGPCQFPDLVHLLLERGERVAAYPALDAEWFDIGTVGELERANARLAEHPELFGPAQPQTSDHLIVSALTTPEHWDEYWDHVPLPVAVTPGETSSTTAILQVIDRFASSPSRLSVLEVGGAPGGYLVHLWRKFGHDVCVLDNSPAGIELSRRNFALLGVPGRVLERDLFAPDDPDLKFDLVFSLGLIEHFQDTTASSTPTSATSSPVAP